MKISEDFVKTGTENECYLVPIGDGYEPGIFKLNETAEKIFDLLKDGKSRDEIIMDFLKEYDSDISETTENVDTFIESLRNSGVIIDD